MTKVYPNANATSTSTPSLSTDTSDGNEAVFTVWKKSLLLNCNGFTVFDAKGNLVFRVDNYVAANKGEILLMDAVGKPLFTIRRKRLSLGDNWVVFEGETAVNPIFSARKHVSIMNRKSLAHLSQSGWSNKNVIYEMEGSYEQRCCAVYDGKRGKVAEIKPKETLGTDVFRLIVQPEIETPVAMTLVILLDQMFGSSGRRSS